MIIITFIISPVHLSAASSGADMRAPSFSFVRVLSFIVSELQSNPTDSLVTPFPF